MSDWQTFFAMGGYAAYVWPAYAISVFALLALGIVSWREMKRSERLARLSETPDRKPQKSFTLS
jgi:heme exporter protein D